MKRKEGVRPEQANAEGGLDVVQCACRAGAIAKRLSLFAGLAASVAQKQVKQVWKGEGSNNSDQVGHDRSVLTAVRDVLFLGPFFRHVEVEFKRVGDG